MHTFPRISATFRFHARVTFGRESSHQQFPGQPIIIYHQNFRVRIFLHSPSSKIRKSLSSLSYAYVDLCEKASPSVLVSVKSRAACNLFLAQLLSLSTAIALLGISE